MQQQAGTPPRKVSPVSPQGAARVIAGGRIADAPQPVPVWVELMDHLSGRRAHVDAYAMAWTDRQVLIV